MKNLLFILTQFLSELGSTITNFGIILWINSKNPNVLTFSLLSISVFLPKIVFGIIIGSIIDRMEKKKLILIADFLIGLSSLVLFILFKLDKVNIPLIILLNFISGIFSCIQDSSKGVLKTIIFSNDEYIKFNGLISFLSGVSMLLSPIIGAFLYFNIGMENIIIIDILTFLIASIFLFNMNIPKENILTSKINLKKIWNDFQFSINEVKKIKELKTLILFYSLVNLFSGMTYFSLISPLILQRTENNGEILGFVNMFLGLGFILGGISVSIFKFNISKEKIIYISIAFSFLCGDLFLAFGRNNVVWYLGAFFASYFIPFSDANKAYIWKDKIKQENRGRIFAYRNTLESLSRPIGMLLGGLIVEYSFQGIVKNNFQLIELYFGNTKGGAIALLFVFTGVLGFCVCSYSLLKIIKRESIKALSQT
ncbi:MFS transporter [uncultured Cetobacterium sp.]|uniref:MFS transporter n=1 Tax=uncultured Cetobacterium sp. TaxID=527638 RepID=UPI00262F6D2A|nr:MFS transporter [uncultured Cetobacterium sp.]